jgi:hypothetical protein
VLREALPVIGFHIDMNMAHYRAEYLRQWLKELARQGYDTVLWEVENSVAWQTCPECVAPDAFTKNQFKALLAECRLLGLEPIPLLQTLGHAEYVLKHDVYAHLRELPERVDQYCPRNAQVLPFLHRWVEEYLELFGAVRYFHIGADETMCLGCCPTCAAYAQEYSLSRLYVDHVNAVAKPLFKRGITPIIWADMALGQHEALDQLSRDIMLFDWRYDVYRGCGIVPLWGRMLKREGKGYTSGNTALRPEELTPEEKATFGTHLFPGGEQAEPNVFYTADFLVAQGFKVVTCPSASSYGDNVFSPRDRLHTANVFDSSRKGLGPDMHGAVLTSWSVHLFPWELQTVCVAAPPFVKANAGASIDEFREHFARERFGGPAEDFWRACDLLSGGCLFTYTSSLGHNKSCPEIPANHAAATLERIRAQGRIQEEADLCATRLAQYNEALELVKGLEATVRRGQELLKFWKLAARNLANRAEVSAFLLAHADEVIAGAVLDTQELQRARIHLARLRALRRETDELYARMIQPHRRALMIGYMFGAVEQALIGLASEK